MARGWTGTDLLRGAVASAWVVTVAALVPAPGPLDAADAKPRSGAYEKQRAKTKKKATRRVKRPPQDDGGPSLAQLFQGALLVAVAVTLWRWRRDTREDDVEAPRSSAYAGPYAGAPVHLPRSPGADPQTVQQEHTLVPLGLGDAAALGGGAPPLGPLGEHDDDPRAIAAEIDALTAREDEGLDLKVKDPKAAGDGKRRRRKAKPPLALPGDLAAHFSGYPGEVLEWHAQLGKDQLGGTVAVTDRRLLAVYRKSTFRPVPPAVEIQIRRFQSPTQALTGVRTVRTRQPLFLAASGLLVWFFPLGTIAAAFGFGAYFAFTRPELEFTTLTGRRRYPVPAAEHESAKRAWHKVKNAQSPESPGRAAG